MTDASATLETSPDTSLDNTSQDSALAPAPEEALVEQDLLVEDVSIDGMCGVY